MSGVSLTDEVLIENLIEHLSVSRMKNSFYKFYRHNCTRRGVCDKMICTHSPPPDVVGSPLPEGAYGVAPLPKVGKWSLCADGSLCGFCSNYSSTANAVPLSRCGSVTLGV